MNIYIAKISGMCVSELRTCNWNLLTLSGEAAASELIEVVPKCHVISTQL